MPSSDYDCYGKFSVAWSGNSAAQRLKDWLDPGNTGATTLQGANPDEDTVFRNDFENP